MDAAGPFIPFVAQLAALAAPRHAANLYAGDGPAATRRHNLALYLARMAERRPRTLLLGEAPGYRGGGVTGVPFTSRAILLAEPSPFGLFGAAAGFRAAAPDAPAREATATVVWETLAALGCLPLLWNAFPLHPHPPGCPAANRPPTTAELAVGEWATRELLRLFAGVEVIAVGRKAAVALGRWGIAHATVRHPGHGGKAAFARDLAGLLRPDGPGQTYGSSAEK